MAVGKDRFVLVDPWFLEKPQESPATNHVGYPGGNTSNQGNGVSGNALTRPFYPAGLSSMHVALTSLL